MFDLEGPPTTESPTPILLHPPDLTEERISEGAEPEFRGIPTDLEPDGGPGNDPGADPGPGRLPPGR
ncbi:MAG: hypothetical protein HUU15_07500 [Candidatus Brocadiae bacterium]|nr:hypothetical protein [Candidatus Brocadiia bacterium]